MENKETTKCYCGHTTTCDCGPEEPKQECTITKIMQMDAKIAYDFLHKQEKIEEAKENAWNNYEHQEGNLYSTAFKSGFDLGVKWHQERMYSEEDMIQFGFWCRYGFLNTEYGFKKLDKHLEQWKQFKK